MATVYSTRPSAILGLPPGSWQALSIDSAALALADEVERAVDKARSRGGSAAAVEGRVRAAVKRILASQRERDAHEAWIEQARARRVEVVRVDPADPSTWRAIVHEDGGPSQ